MKSKYRNALVGAALMGSTALTPVEAHAAPVFAFFGTLFAGGGIVAAFTASAATLGITSAVGITLYAVGVSLVVGIGLLKLAEALMPKPRTPDPSDRMVNFAQPITYFDNVYGRARKGGPIGYTNFANNQRRVVVIFAGHEINAYESWWLDEWNTTLTGTAVDRTPPGSLAEVHPRLGTDPQALLPCVSIFDELTSDHDFAGLAVAELVANKPAPEAFTDNYPRGREWTLTSLIQGRNDVYDPRTDTFGFTDNAALIIAHWITYYMEKDVDWTEVAEQANIADTVVSSRYSGNIKKWTLNGVFSDSESDETIRAQLGLACDAFFYERPDGSVGFKVGAYTAPTVILSEFDFYSVTVADGTSDLDANNEVTINYVEPAREWRQQSSGAWVFDPEGRRTRTNVSSYFINNHNQAVRVAKRISRAQHAQYSLRGVIKYVGHTIVGERFIRVQHAELGVDEVFEVQDLRRSEDGLTFQIEAISVVSDDFAFDHTTEEPARPNTEESQEGDTDYTPTNITAVSSPVSGTASIFVEWDAAYPSAAHRVRWSVSGLNQWTESEIVGAGIEAYRISPLVDGTTYDVQVAAVGGVTGVFLSTYRPTTALSVQVVSNPTPPAALVSFSVAEVAGDAVVSLTSPNDPNYYATRIYRSLTNTFGSASVVVTEYGAPNSADSFTDTSVVSGETYYYWGEPINSSDQPGTVSGPVSITMS